MSLWMKYTPPHEITQADLQDLADGGVSKGTMEILIAAHIKRQQELGLDPHVQISGKWYGPPGVLERLRNWWKS